MASRHIRPCSINEHPAMMQKYILPTPSIDAFYERVKKCIRFKTPGAIIYAHPRFGKTYGTRYVMNVLGDDFPNIVVVRFLCLKSGTHSENAFFTNLLEAIYHEKAHAGITIRKRSRLLHRLREMVDRSGQNVLAVFADEAQRMGVLEYEWLRDVHDELENAGIRMITFLVGQPDLLNQKNAFRVTKQTQIVARFMIDELHFRGLCSVTDVATCLAGYDQSRFPPDSDWAYTQFFFPRAYDDGMRFLEQANLVWNAFSEAHRRAGFPFLMEIPMQYFVRAVEFVFTEYSQRDADDFRTSPEIWTKAVAESNYVAAQEELRLVMPVAVAEQ